MSIGIDEVICIKRRMREAIRDFKLKNEQLTMSRIYIPEEDFTMLVEDSNNIKYMESYPYHEYNFMIFWGIRLYPSSENIIKVEGETKNGGL